MPGIQDKVVAITGQAAALALAERDAKVALGARWLERLEALPGRIAARGGEATYARADVRRREDHPGVLSRQASASGGSMRW